MKIQQTSQQNQTQERQKFKSNISRQNPQNTDQQKVSFGNITSALNFLQTNQGVGAACVDLFSMVLPRTAVDFTRGPDAGVETARREFSSAINDAIIGVYGMIAAGALAVGINSKFGVKAHKMFISGDMLDLFAQAWQDKKASTNEETLHGFLKHVASEAKGFNPNINLDEVKNTNGWVGIDLDTQKKVVEKLKDGILNLPNEIKTKEDKAAYGKFKAHVKALIVGSTGVESEFKLEKETGKIIKGEKEIQKATASVDDLIDNIYKSSKTFMSDKVAAEFKPGVKIADNAFVKGMKNLNKGTALLGLALSLVVGLSIQPLNVYLTKKKTGKTGFVGVEGKEGDKTGGFSALKLGVGALAMAGALATIGKPSEILKKIQFKSLYPTVDQFKLVYGTTIVSRILSARDKNELRETTTKDSMGFVNWLILGGFVSKLTAAGFEKLNIGKFIKYNTEENGKSWFDWLTKSSFVTREEFLHKAFKDAGVSTQKSKDVAFTFKEMLQEMAKNPKLAGAKTKLKYFTFIQFAGYLYSGLVLGVGMPKFNIAMTKLAEKKRKAEEEAKANAAA